MFDRAADPLEQHDLFNEEGCSQIRDELLHALLLWRAETTDVWHLKHHRHGGGRLQGVWSTIRSNCWLSTRRHASRKGCWLQAYKWRSSSDARLL
ncbi:hypothetical protein ACHHV8_23010 [Paenibacillus sp. TAB 01]|uniref:hypothetical protein n=1 Tax=Paenibacillus sp. TAB 01 TaxID=3368988 RepID=UPI0037522294